MKKFLLILSFLALFFPKIVLGEENINKFGIHILEPSDLQRASELVNSGGGDWGWVTVVIRDDDLNQDKWQDFMDECRIKHLIPLVRIATHLEGKYWSKPTIEESRMWTNFLSSLNWPTTDRYVIIFNEPNHIKEWGGETNPKEYAEILSAYSDAFKEKNLEFKILNAGFDLAAPNGKETMDAYQFWTWMKVAVPDVFEKIDGWSSHSYPNHGFKGKPWETGRLSIRGYDWELSILRNQFALKKDLPVFITETGWPKEEPKYAIRNTQYGKQKVLISKYINPETAGDYLVETYEKIWLDDYRVKAVTPFVLNYPDDLFADFSWLDKSGNPYPQFEKIKSLIKQSWWPEQEEKFEMKSLVLPSFMPTNTTFKGVIILKNTGQSIWGERGEWKVENMSARNINVSNLVLPANIKVLPGESAHIDFTITTSSESGNFDISWTGIPSQKLKVLPESIITTARYTFWEKFLLKIKTFLKII